MGPPGHLIMNGDDQGYYQNIGTANLQQPMPLRYNNGPGPQGPPGPPVPPTLMGQQNQRFGSQNSLQQRQPEQRFQQQPQNESVFHATPRIVGTPQSSAGNGPTRLVSVGSALTPTGPEKPQRTYEEKARSISQGNAPRGVRFQDPKEDKVNKQLVTVNKQLTFVNK